MTKVNAVQGMFNALCKIQEDRFIHELDAQHLEDIRNGKVVLDTLEVK